ncbi:hypothetical protein PFBG_05299 [Plasmodium falciparum 7G8]|uniref:Uncharacterized protein n=2 Tax=Plasmodium falciparum TaxID=5833 RepID=A0A024WHV8_PLAFA|nr:hypothetical protein PFMALIP_05085 [Plasmodium falciparum MaliPS096_E11]EUR63551.1 hypothetical protein PFBG_05299 [Plasmodium falciparum 7G8]
MINKAHKFFYHVFSYKYRRFLYGMLEKLRKRRKYVNYIEFFIYFIMIQYYEQKLYFCILMMNRTIVNEFVNWLS